MLNTYTAAMTATPLPKLPKPVRDLIALLRARDVDPAYDDAPVLDAYARISISIDGETEKTDRQLLDVLRSIAARRARLGEVHRDDNLSAWKRNGKRPGWRALMVRFETKQIDGAVAWHVDRMMRQPFDLEKLIELADRGATIGNCLGEYRLDDADHRFTLRILVAAACKASDDASRRQKRKHEAMRDAGRVNGGPRPFGHQTMPPGKPIPADRLQAERAAVAWSVSALLDGTPQLAVAAELNRRGVLTVTGRTWYDGAIRNMVLKARHAGLIEHDGRIGGRALDVDPIITVEDYAALAAMYQARSKGKRGRPVGPSARYVLSGVLRCAVCSTQMGAMIRARRTSDDRDPYVTYRCPAHGCPAAGRPSNSISGRAIVEWAKAQAIANLSDPRHARMVARRATALARKDESIDAADRDVLALAGKWGAGTMTLGEWETASAALKARLKRLHTERDALLAGGAASLDAPSDAAVLAADWARGSDHQRRRLLLSAMPFGIGVQPAALGLAPVDRLFVISGPPVAVE